MITAAAAQVYSIQMKISDSKWKHETALELYELANLFCCFSEILLGSALHSQIQLHVVTKYENTRCSYPSLLDFRRL